MLKDVPVVEMDSWFQYTKWNEVLSQSKHGLVKTFHYTRMPDPDEPERVVYVARPVDSEFTSTEVARIEAVLALHNAIRHR